MPGLDGPGLSRLFRADPVLATVLVILASSLTLPPGDVPLLHDLFVQKPAEMLSLLDAISSLIAIGGTDDPAPLGSASGGTDLEE
jgi:hypothetical protein